MRKLGLRQLRRLVLANGGAEVPTQVCGPQCYALTIVISEYLIPIFMELIGKESNRKGD